MSYDIFLSYRRKDADGHSNAGTARTFMYEFERRQYTVFFDYKDCTDEYFSDTILSAIRTCRHFVLVLTPGCLGRCKSKGDWLRREVEEAIKYGRKIIPITPDGEFDAWPNDLPETMKDLDGLQITTIHMDGTFEGNVAKLVSDRMNPPQRRKVDGMENYPKLKVRSNLDCVMYVDEEECAKVKADKLEKVPLKAGEYMLKFESVENASDSITDEFTMPDKDKLYIVDLLKLKQEREKKEREERDRQEKERKEREERERKEREERERKEREARGEFEVNGVKFKMIYVEGGTFTMGATKEQGDDAYGYEKPAHMVTISNYYIGETMVTQGLWKSVMGGNPSRFKGDNLPVESVSWEDVHVFIATLNKKTGREFRLPTEAEWEFAARGGKKSKGYKYSGSDNIDEVAWYDGNSGGKTHPVKGKNANELGLYDMSGNVSEWCSDFFGDYNSYTQKDPNGPSMGADRVHRGGSMNSLARRCRVSYRNISVPNYRSEYLGFRLVISSLSLF